jgi:hypothetical protein
LAQARGAWVGAIADALFIPGPVSSLQADRINISWVDKDVNDGHCPPQDGRRHSLHWRLASAHGVKVG